MQPHIKYALKHFECRPLNREVNTSCIIQTKTSNTDNITATMKNNQDIHFFSRYKIILFLYILQMVLFYCQSENMFDKLTFYKRVQISFVKLILQLIKRIFVLFQSFFTAVGFFASNYISLYWQLLVLTVTGTVGVLCYIYVSLDVHRQEERHKKSVQQTKM